MIKNFKKGLIIISILLVLFLVIGSIYAYDELDDLSLENEGINPNIENNPIYYIISKIIDNKNAPDGSLISLNYYQKNNNYYAKLIWNSKKGEEYQILRKSNEDYEVISTVIANNTKTTFNDKIEKNKLYIYSVRKVIKNSKEELILESYDKEGLKLMKEPSVKVDFQNLKAKISWSKVDNATKYCVFRKVNNGRFKCIANVSGNQLNYTDDYYKSFHEFPNMMIENTFIDPSCNDISYTVRAYNSKKFNNVEKTSYSLYLYDGDFHLEPPSIISLKNNKIKWNKVPNAEGYLILKSNSPESGWKEICQVKENGKSIKSKNLKNIDYDCYYTIKAYANKNGKIVYSNYDKGFTLKNFSKDYSKEKILYIGDSITYGSPYKSKTTRHIYSIPYRVGELLGCNYYNPSIPGSTYHDLGQNFFGKNIENGEYYRYRICREVVDQISKSELPGNWESLDNSKNSLGQSHTTIEDYNIVVLSAGTNDYLDNTELGSLDSKDVSTFNGALNHILEKIEQASKNRVQKGEKPIKVVFVDLYYSDRNNNYTTRHNRDVTPNKIGLTLTDYQNVLDNQLLKWQSNSKYLTFYNFKTREYNIVNEENCPYTSSDNLHFTKFTYGQYGEAFAQFLVDKVF